MSRIAKLAGNVEALISRWPIESVVVAALVSFILGALAA